MTWMLQAAASMQGWCPVNCTTRCNASFVSPASVCERLLSRETYSLEVSPSLPVAF